MAINKPLENWTKFPNCILDNIDKYTANEFKILAFMVRKNEGYQDPNKMFSIRYISIKTQISRPTVIKSIKSLLEKQSIEVIKVGDRGIRFFNIKWQEPLLKFDRSKGFTITD